MTSQQSCQLLTKSQNTLVMSIAVLPIHSQGAHNLNRYHRKNLLLPHVCYLPFQLPRCSAVPLLFSCFLFFVDVGSFVGVSACGPGAFLADEQASKARRTRHAGGDPTEGSDANKQQKTRKKERRGRAARRLARKIARAAHARHFVEPSCSHGCLCI